MRGSLRGRYGCLRGCAWSAYRRWEAGAGVVDNRGSVLGGVMCGWRTRAAAPRPTSRPDDRQYLVPDLRHRRLVPRLRVQAQQGFRVGRADVEPPVGGRDREAVQVVERDALLALVRGADRGEAVRLVGDRGVDLAGARVAVVRGHEAGQRAVLAAEGGEDVEGGQHAGVGVPEVLE